MTSRCGARFEQSLAVTLQRLDPGIELVAGRERKRLLHSRMRHQRDPAIAGFESVHGIDQAIETLEKDVR